MDVKNGSKIDSIEMQNSVQPQKKSDFICKLEEARGNQKAKGKAHISLGGFINRQFLCLICCMV